VISPGGARAGEGGVEVDGGDVGVVKGAAAIRQEFVYYCDAPRIGGLRLFEVVREFDRLRAHRCDAVGLGRGRGGERAG
jgi:hypothetical protein